MDSFDLKNQMHLTINQVFLFAKHQFTTNAIMGNLTEKERKLKTCPINNKKR